jgi:hypothetical protein
MHKYKTLLLIPIIAIALVVLADIGKALYHDYNFTLLKYVEFVQNMSQAMCTYALLVVLKKHHEKRSLLIPFYLNVVVRIIFHVYTVLRVIDKHQITLTPDPLRYVMISVSAVSYLYFIISTFFVKAEAIKTYFTTMGLMLLFSAILVTVLQMLMVMHWPSVAFQYRQYILDLITLSPTFVTLALLFHLYSKHELFNPGDRVISLKDFENVPKGTKGTIVQKHKNSSYYEVEFLDSSDNLLNVLAIGNESIEHDRQPDGLEARIQNFGQA